ncbi:MAG: hypothetical protein R3254_10580, partial [Thiomicrorhabdus sp.]|nr:hypothetical protein [Thiomicrorhabdus sp.]
LLSSPLVFAQEANEPSAIQKAYSAQLNSGKDYKDAYAALAHEIAYETAAVQSRQPCRKMVRGL